MAASPNASPEPTPRPAPAPADLSTEDAENHWSYGVLFQAWLILFLLVICFALVNYLVTYIPR